MSMMESDMGEELKPCPFCGYGGEPEIMTWREPYRSNIVYGVQCMACGAIGEMGKTRELAAKHWNERAERSAEVVGVKDAYSGFDYCCSNCREVLHVEIQDDWDEYRADPAHVDKPVEYCPFCGARFIDERRSDDSTD